MKKLILVVALAVAHVAAFAADHLPQSFLNVSSLQVSNVAAISNRVMYPLMTNIFGTYWTNSGGTLVGVTNAGNTALLIKDVALWSDTLGRVPVMQMAAVPGTTTNYLNISPATLSLKLLGGAGANSAVTFTFTPIWKNPAKQMGIPYIATAHDWSVAVTAASGTVTFATNAPMHLWPGAYGLRLRSIVNADTDYTGNVWVQECDLNGFRP